MFPKIAFSTQFWIGMGPKKHSTHDLEGRSEADTIFLGSELGARHQVPLQLMYFVADLMAHLMIQSHRQVVAAAALSPPLVSPTTE